MELTLNQQKVLSTVAEVSQKLGMSVFVVGGVIRDLLHLPGGIDRDLDLVVEGDSKKFAEHCNQEFAGELKSFSGFLTCKIVSPASLREIEEIDFASARSEIYAQPGALPQVKQASIEQDLWRRDFSINAMALEVKQLLLICNAAQQALRSAAQEGEKREAIISSIKEAIYDPTGGLSDLASKTVRVLHDQSFVDDPTRMFRALRYCHRLGFSLDNQTEKLFRSAISSDVLKTISSVRSLNEVRKCCAEAGWLVLLGELAEQGLLTGSRLASPGSERTLIIGLEELAAVLHSKKLSQEAALTLHERQIVVISLLVLSWPENQRSNTIKSFQLSKNFSREILEKVDIAFNQKFESKSNTATSSSGTTSGLNFERFFRR